jgi:hypothetical protein
MLRLPEPLRASWVRFYLWMRGIAHVNKVTLADHFTGT